MTNTYFTWDDLVDSWGAEMRIADDVFQSMVSCGLKDWDLIAMDFAFISDRPENLRALRKVLESQYGYTVTKLEKFDDLWELSGNTPEFPITGDSLMYWALDMALRGYDCDAEFDAYGGRGGPDSFHGIDVSPARADHWRNWAIERYEAGDRAAAQWGLSAAIAGDATDANAWYARAIVRSELLTWKSAMRDYDEALRIAPDFPSALLNRGALKDDNGDPQGAIADYERVLASAADDETKTRAYFNRGNSRFRLGDTSAACADWRVARERGAEYANERLAEYCREH